MTIVEFDTRKRHPTRAQAKNGEWWRVHGKCLRCGRCCPQDCESFTHEVVDNKRIAKCAISFRKPFMCAVYPLDPFAPLKDGCGFSWEKE